MTAAVVEGPGQRRRWRLVAWKPAYEVPMRGHGLVLRHWESQRTLTAAVPLNLLMVAGIWLWEWARFYAPSWLLRHMPPALPSPPTPDTAL